jgi:hypothetical protein
MGSDGDREGPLPALFSFLVLGTRSGCRADDPDAHNPVWVDRLKQFLVDHRASFSRPHRNHNGHLRR